MILALQSDAISMARAKGISPRRVLWVHVLRMSILTLMTSVALSMAALIGGTVVIEAFFGPKGIGERLLFAIQQNDLLVIQAIVAILVVTVVSPTSSLTSCTPSSIHASAWRGRWGDTHD